MLLKSVFLCILAIVLCDDYADEFDVDDCPMMQDYAGHYECYNTEGEVTDCLARMPHGTNVQLLCGNLIDEIDCVSGEWSIPFPECHQRGCDMLTSDSVDFQCGKVTLLWNCQDDSDQLCEQVRKSVAPNIEQCTPELDHNTIVHSKCKNGFFSTLDSLDILQCKDGRWDTTTPECTRITGGARITVPTYIMRMSPLTRLPGSGCTLPPIPDHGSYALSGYENGHTPGDIVKEETYLTYSCEVNYALSESTKYAVCEKNNTWHLSPFCRKKCPMLSSYTVDFRCISPTTKELVECEPNVPSETTVLLKCKEMHKRSYLPKLVCKDGDWNFTALPDCKPECGVEKSEGITHIIYGSRVAGNAFPWHVGIYQDMGEERGLEQICGGSLIQRHVVVSAAHCFYNTRNNEPNDPRLYRVAAGKFYRSWDYEKERGLQHNIQKSEVERIFLHKEYRGDHKKEANDLALLVLKEPFSLTHSVLPVCYNFGDKIEDQHYFTAGTFGKVAGWGLNEQQVSSEELRYLNVPVIDSDECFDELQKYNFGNYLTSDKICTGYTNGSTVCKGDSGGGLVFSRKLDYQRESRWFLQGIVSNGPLNANKTSCHPMTYSAYTRIIKLNDWLLPLLHDTLHIHHKNY